MPQCRLYLDGDQLCTIGVGLHSSIEPLSYTQGRLYYYRPSNPDDHKDALLSPDDLARRFNMTTVPPVNSAYVSLKFAQFIITKSRTPCGEALREQMDAFTLEAIVARPLAYPAHASRFTPSEDEQHHANTVAMNKAIQEFAPGWGCSPRSTAHDIIKHGHGFASLTDLNQKANVDVGKSLPKHLDGQALVGAKEGAAGSWQLAWLARCSK